MLTTPSSARSGVDAPVFEATRIHDDRGGQAVFPWRPQLPDGSLDRYAPVSQSPMASRKPSLVLSKIQSHEWAYEGRTITFSKQWDAADRI